MMPTIAGIISGAGGIIINYLLNSNFTGDDKTLFNNDVLGSVEGVSTGALRTVDTSVGVVNLASNRISMRGNQTWGTTGLKFETGVTKEMGVVFKGVMQNSVTNSYGYFPAWRNANDLEVGDRVFQMAMNNVSLLSTGSWEPVGTVQDVWKPFIYSATTDYGFAMILGGFDVNGNPHVKGSTTQGFDYGCYYYIKDAGQWQFYFATKVNNNTPLYAGMLSYSPNLINICDDLKVVKSLTKVFEDTFTDPNNTLITDHTPDLGNNSWTSENTYDSSGGSATIKSEIISNELKCTTTSGTAVNRILNDTEYSEIDFSVKYYRGGSTSNGGTQLYFRWEDSSNYTTILVDYASTQKLKLLEYSGGSVVHTSPLFPVTFNVGETKTISVTTVGYEVKISVDNIIVYEYTSTSGLTATICGVRVLGSATVPGSRVDNFVVVDNSDTVDKRLLDMQSPTVFDSFTDDDLTDITSHISDSGHSWTTEITYDGGGTRYIQIENNKAYGYASSGTSTFRCFVDSGTPDAVVECTVYRGGASNNYGTGMLCRYIDSNNYLTLQGTNTGTLTISEKVGGVTMGSFSGGTFTVGQTTDFKIVMHGRYVEIYQDGTLLTSWTGTDDATGTQHGFLTLGTTATDSNHENFSVQAIGTSDEYVDLDLY
ncbi:hypothetical protein GQ473_01420 [archaeon]|nr:hypothetical protein [archaeon]